MGKIGNAFWRAPKGGHSDSVPDPLAIPELGKLLCRLSGARGMRCCHDQALIKQPFANPTAWHLDNPYWSFHSQQSISIWIAMEDATFHNGCIWFIPGTHKLARFDNVGIGQNMDDLFGLYPEMAKIDSCPCR